jgi:LCP family protein required for cell wall assembly
MHPDNALMQRPSVFNGRTPATMALAAIGLLLGSCASNESPAASPASSPEPTASPTFAAELMDRRWNVLYVGTDLNEEREADGHPPNADAIMLVSLSADQSELTLVSLPRDTVDIPLPDGSVYPQKINGLYTSEGIDALVGAMESLYDVEIDGHVVLDMTDFHSLVDAVDGVEVTLEEPLVDPIVNLDLEAGTHTLNPSQALGYVRTRVDQDYGRMGRQQEVIVELVGRLVDPETDLDLADLIEGLDSLETDLPFEELPTLLELARRAGEADVTELLIEPPLIVFEGDRGDGRGYILEPDVEAIRAEVQELIGE